MQNLKGKKIIILSHIFTTVPAEDLKKYVLEQGSDELLYIGHPLLFVNGRPGSTFAWYRNKKLIKFIQYKNRDLPSTITYICDFFISFFWIARTGQKWDIMVALDNLNTITGLSLKLFGRVNKVIYYTIDFVPQRFSNRLLNDFYHYLDKLSVAYADLTWNISPRIAEGREKVRGLQKKKYTKQMIVPIGIWNERIPKNTFTKINPHHLVYAGGLVPHQGVQIVIDTVPLVTKKIKDFQFLIIGIGAYEQELRSKVKKLKIEKNVKFLGYKEKLEEVEAILSKCGLAVAMYSPKDDIWSAYADPSKIKTYLACGLPVVTTNVTYFGKEIEKNECGVVIKYDAKILARTIISIMNNTVQHKKMRENALKLAEKFNWNKIFSEGFERVL